MSFRVVADVLDHSRARGTDRLVLVAVAECAWHDGVTWLRIGEGPGDEKSICHSANCSKREAVRAVQVLRDELRELETRKVRRGRSFITVYRVVVGQTGERPIDYERVPFPIPEPFLQGDNLARWRVGPAGIRLPDSPSHASPLDGDGSSPSTRLLTVPAETVHGDNRDPFTVTASRAREERTTREPSSDRSTRAGAREPSSDDQREDLQGIRARLRERAGLIRIERKRSACDECGVGGGRHTHDCGSARETVRQAYDRFVDETAADPSYPLEEINTIIAGWDDIDDVDRQELVERAEQVRRDAARKAAA